MMSAELPIIKKPHETRQKLKGQREKKEKNQHGLKSLNLFMVIHF